MSLFEPGQSGHPSGSKGNKRRSHNKEVFDAIKSAGYLDPLIRLAKISHESENEGVAASAAASLANYCHPKLQSIPTPRFNPTPWETDDFQTSADAERFIAKIASATARGELDFQSALELTTIAKTWIDARATSEIEQRLVTIEQSLDITSPSHVTTAVVGGLPTLPGTNIVMPGDQDNPPLTDGPATNGGDP